LSGAPLVLRAGLHPSQPTSGCVGAPGSAAAGKNRLLIFPGDCHHATNPKAGFAKPRFRPRLQVVTSPFCNVPFGDSLREVRVSTPSTQNRGCWGPRSLSPDIPAAALRIRKVAPPKLLIRRRLSLLFRGRKYGNVGEILADRGKAM